MSADADQPIIHIFETAEKVARAAAQHLIEIGKSAIESHGRFNVALAGGSTPKRVYELLASEEFAASVEWSRTHIFFGDERCVPPDDAESNFRMAQEALLSRVPIPEMNVHRIEGRGDAKANARLYEDELRGAFPNAEWPAFDLILLGMGDDGHTASLFPESAALQEQTAWVVANWAEKFKTWRITLSAPAINHARHVTFNVTGDSKAERLREVLEGYFEPHRLPAQLVRLAEGSVEWFVDKAAASAL